MKNLTSNNRWQGYRSVLALSLLTLMQVPGAVAADLTLNWDDVSDARVDHYQVHWGSSSGSYSNSIDKSRPPVTLNDLADGQTYYVAVRACAADGVECSGYSNEVTVARWFDGPIDGVRILQQGLDAAEVRALASDSIPIPTLNQYGLAILALLVLGAGLVGFRRFA